MDGVTAQRRRERTVSAFASSSKPVHFSAASSPQQQQKPLPSAAQHHFRKRVKSENTRDRPTSLSSAYLQPVQQQQRASIIGPRLPKQSHRQRVSSQETSHGFVSLNSILDTVGLPRPPPVATYQPGSRPLKSSLKESRTRFQQPHGLDNSQAASSVPHSLLDPISLDPGYSIKKPDTTQSHSYRPSNAQSVQTLASSLQRHNTISSSNHQEQYGYDQETPALSSEQSWYLLRTLVELEIEEESTKLWKLTGGLNADSVEWDSAYDFGSDDPTTTEE